MQILMQKFDQLKKVVQGELKAIINALRGNARD